MAYNHGREDRKWRIWKEAEEKLLRECGVDEVTIEQIRIADRADFNSKLLFLVFPRHHLKIPLRDTLHYLVLIERGKQPVKDVYKRQVVG